jgi:hypothetical protein
MNIDYTKKLKSAIAFAVVIFAVSQSLFGDGTAFTYQGRLADNGSLPNATYDMRFSLYDAAANGNQVGSPIIRTGVLVNGGLFTTSLDFGPGIFTGPDRWLKIEISPANANNYTALIAPQQLTPAPYAIRAGDAGTLGGQSSSAFAPAFGSSAYVAKTGDTMTGSLIIANGMVGIGTSNPGELLTIGGVTSYNNGLKITGSAAAGAGFALESTGAGGHKYALFSGGAADDVGAGGFGVYDDSVSAYRLAISSGGQIGIGTTAPDAALHVINPTGFNLPGIHVEQPASFDFAQIRLNVAGFPYWALTVGSGSTPSLNFGFNNAQMMNLASDGTLQVKVLQINGADLAEPFEVSTGELPKGSVVVIDEENPGHVKISQRAYDKRVAGILSGANGVNSGVCLKQQGFNDGGQNVALSGRVYALADASYGTIQPGDPLTTSDTPGHCMKATDHARAQGAIIGKAMSSLDHGRGMVLVLVSLQ